MTWILAIDPGLTGAFALYDPAYPERVSVYDMPTVNGGVDVHEVRRMLTHYEPGRAYLEQVGPMPRDGVRQAWRFSGAYHAAKTVIELCLIPYVLIPPGTWKKALHLKGGMEGKGAGRAMAMRLFPHNAEMFTRVKDHGRADAALLAYYAVHNLKKEGPNDRELHSPLTE